MPNNKIIIYDDSCPLCAAYTKGFVSAGLIDKENRKNFTTIDPDLLALLDQQRCPNEIPVIDFDSKEVLYGIDAITSILQTRIPAIKELVKLKCIKWPLDKLYKLISYNRRVIVASKMTRGNFDCTPDFNYKYRLAFMAIFLVFNTIMLFPIQFYILQNSFSSVTAKELQIAHLALVTVNIIIACCLNKKTAFEYLGQVNMLALITILATLPLLLLNKYKWIPGIAINNIYLCPLIFFVFKGYKRRMDFAGIAKQYPIIYFINIIGICGFVLFLIL